MARDFLKQNHQEPSGKGIGQVYNLDAKKAKGIHGHVAGMFYVKKKYKKLF